VRRVGLAAVGLVLAACASSAPSGSRSAAPSPTVVSPARAISFTATDGARLSGRLYGTGTTAVVLSNMGDNDPALWDGFAPRLAARGYLVMTYSYRYPANVQTFTSDMAQHTVDDLRGAIAQLRAGGAQNVVLAGGSLGGMATAKVAASAQAAAMVVLAAPVDLADYGFHVTPAELRGSMPKLFIGADRDSVVPIAQTRRMYELAAQPKELTTYDASEHALHLLEGAHGTELADLLVTFVTTNVSST